jgi:long-chain acyl-CoA synthetase
MKIFGKEIGKPKYAWHKFYKKEERDIEVPNVSLYEYLVERNKDNLHSLAINYFDHKLNFSEFIDQINMCARAFRSQGIRPGDVVTICMPNTPEAVISLYAVNKIGAIANMLHPLSAEEEIKYSLISTKSVMLVAVNLSYEKLKNIIDDTNVYKTIIVSPSDSMPTLLKFGYYITKGRKVRVPKNQKITCFGMIS